MRRAGLWLLLLAAPVWADEVPLNVGVTVLLKVLTYETSFDTRGSGDFVVLVPHAPERKGEADAAVDALAPIAKVKLKSRTLSFVPVKAADLAATVEAKKASAILVLEGSGESLRAEAGRLGRSAHVYTLGLGEDSAHSGVALAVTLKDSKPQVVVNITQARAEGDDFPQSILKLARVVR